ncbi:MAG: Wzz/FepE/Etk N-terminal domain-containing protein [Gammaproteobacteria bacterium]
MSIENTIEANAPLATQANNSDSDLLSIVDLVQILLRYKVAVIAIFLLFSISATVYAFAATPIYRAEITLAPSRGGAGGSIGSMISQFGGALGGLAGMVGMSRGSAGSGLTRGEALTSITSTSHLQDFIKSRNLLPVLFPEIWDPDSREWTVSSESDIPTLSDGYDLFSNKIMDVTEDPITGIVNLSIEWSDPELAAEWANELVGLLNSRLRAKSIDESDRTIKFLNQELEQTKVVELRQAIFFMIEQRIGEKTSARVKEEYAFKIINPALAPDADKFVSPDRPFIILMGLLSGAIAGIFGAFLVYAIGRLRQEYRGTVADH